MIMLRSFFWRCLKVIECIIHKAHIPFIIKSSVVYYNGGVLNLQACRCAVRDLFARWFRAANRFEDDDLLES